MQLICLLNFKLVRKVTPRSIIESDTCCDGEEPIAEGRPVGGGDDQRPSRRRTKVPATDDIRGRWRPETIAHVKTLPRHADIGTRTHIRNQLRSRQAARGQMLKSYDREDRSSSRVEDRLQPVALVAGDSSEDRVA